MSIVQIKLTDLVFDPQLQMRASTDPDIAASWAEKLKADKNLDFAPIRVFADKDDDGREINRVADGFQRGDAYTLAGRKTIPAKLTKGTFRQAFEFALGANEENGVARTEGDRRKAIAAAIAFPEFAKLSDRKIAEIIKCHHSTVSRIRPTLQPTDVPRSEQTRTVIRKGKEVEQKVGVRGKEAKKKREAAATVEEREKAAPAKPPAPTDLAGNYLPKNLLKVDFGATAAQAIATAIKSECAQVESMIDTGRLSPLIAGDVPASLKAATAQLLKATPFAVCPPCEGSGARGGGNCKGCGGNGWITKEQYDRVPPDVLEKFKAAQATLFDQEESDGA